MFHNAGKIVAKAVPLMHERPFAAMPAEIKERNLFFYLTNPPFKVNITISS